MTLGFQLRHITEVLALLGLSDHLVQQAFKDPKVILEQLVHRDLMARKVFKVCQDLKVQRATPDLLGRKVIRVIQDQQAQQDQKVMLEQRVRQEPLGPKVFQALQVLQVLKAPRVTRVTKVTLAQVSPSKAVCLTPAVSQMISDQTMREVGGSRKMMGTCGFGTVIVG